MKLTTTHDVYAAAQIICNHAQDKQLNYAVPYANALIHDIAPSDTNAVYTQCLYILNNIVYWRHPSASHVRTTLRTYVKENAPRA